MNREHVVGIALVALLLGGLLLLSRRSTAMTQYSPALAAYSGNISMVPMAAEPKRYQNKETRRIEYNEDGLPITIEITRDYAVT